VSGSVKNIIENYITRDKLEDLSYFFDLEVLSYLNEKNKKEIYKILKASEDRYQKDKHLYEREYFNKILGKIT